MKNYQIGEYKKKICEKKSQMKEKERKRNHSKQNITVKEPVIGSKPT
jgi:hypothetical protein